MTADLQPLRPAGLADAAALGAMHVASWQGSYRGILADGYLDRMSVPRRVARWRRILRTTEPRALTLVLEDSGGIAGFGSVGPQREEGRPADAELRALYVLRRCQGRGCGRRLMGALARFAAGWGAMSLDLWVLAANARAVAFYEALGGKPGVEQTFRIARRPVTERAYAWANLAPLVKL